MERELTDEEVALQRQREEAVKAKKEYESLLEHPGWIRLVADVTDKLNASAQLILGSALQSELGVYHQEFDKGQLKGMQFVLGLPALEIETNKDIKEAIDERPSDED